MKRFKEWHKSKPLLLLAFVLILVVLGFFTPLFKDLVWIGPAEAYAYNEGTDPFANENEGRRRLHIGPFSFPIPGEDDLIVSSEEQQGVGGTSGSGLNGNGADDAGTNAGGTNVGGKTNVSETNVGETNIGKTNVGERNISETNAGETDVNKTNINTTNINTTNINTTNAGGTNATGTRSAGTSGGGINNGGINGGGIENGGTEDDAAENDAPEDDGTKPPDTPKPPKPTGPTDPTPDPLEQFRALQKLASAKSEGLQDAQSARDSVVAAQETAYGSGAHEDVLQELDSQHETAEKALRETTVYDSISNELQTIISNFEERNGRGESWKSMESEINNVRAEYGMQPITISAN